MFGEGLDAFGSGEAFGTAAMIVFIVLALIYYFLNDIKKISQSVAKSQ